MRREIVFPTAGVSAGRSQVRARPQTPLPRETEFGHEATLPPFCPPTYVPGSLMVFST